MEILHRAQMGQDVYIYGIRTHYIYIYIYILAECVALWGEPEQAVHGTIERRAASSSDMKGKRAII